MRQDRRAAGVMAEETIINSVGNLVVNKLKSLSTITENNKVLVETNASFVGNVNTKMEDIEQKVDRI